MGERRLPLGMTPRLLDDAEVAAILGYRCAAAFRRHRKALEAQGFPKRRPIVKRYSPTEIRAWIDGADSEPQQSRPDPLLGVAGQWGVSR
jgi:predicted DNA-binding transcriptional regulator AlpA